MQKQGFSYVEILVSIGIWLTLLMVIFQFSSQYQLAHRQYLKLAEANYSIANLLENNLATSFEESSGQLLSPALKIISLTPTLELYKYDE